MAEVCCGKPVVVFQARMVFYCLLIFFSFFIFVGISVMKDKAYDRGSGCPLYVDYLEMGEVLAPDSLCNFPMAVAIIFQLLYLLFRTITLACDEYGKINEENRYCLFNGCMELVYVVVELMSTFFTFIGACILSSGKNSACEDGGCEDLDWISPATAAEAGAWISTLLWCVALAFGLLTIYRSGKVCRGGGPKSQAVSMDEFDKTLSSPPLTDV